MTDHRCQRRNARERGGSLSHGTEESSTLTKTKMHLLDFANEDQRRSEKVNVYQ